MKISRKYFRAAQFFRPEFTFNIIRQVHYHGDYNDSIRCKREFWKIIYVESGSGWKIINDKKYILKPGCLFLIHPNDCTTFIIESEKIEIFNILFMPQLLEAEINKLSDDFDFFTILHPNFHQEIEETRREMLYILEARNIHSQIKNLEKEFNDKLPNFRNSIRFKLLDLLIQISRLSSKKVRKKTSFWVVSYIKHVIEKHYAEDFDLGVLAGKIGLNKSTLCRMFKTESRMTITEALRQRRLAAAKQMLTIGGKTITETCYDCGFNDLSYFYRVFKLETGLNPGGYQKKFGLY
ncbi:MAG: AraC family transcriptional regulator [Victivallales bacterium]|jgi:AraC-like DNA-binding protein